MLVQFNVSEKTPCMVSVMVVEISLNVHMVNEVRHLKHIIFRMENYILYVKYIACHMPNLKPLLSETVILLALIEDNCPLRPHSFPA